MGANETGETGFERHIGITFTKSCSKFNGTEGKVNPPTSLGPIISSCSEGQKKQPRPFYDSCNLYGNWHPGL
ncbi:hypothetical protein E2542_SST16691 [Spatholobus suberectus]|nr:hypothetical protein E2542_SST16691 [Spatholobus suberectus]